MPILIQKFTMMPIFILSTTTIRNIAVIVRLNSNNTVFRNAGNKVRKILELEMNTPATKSHTIFTISCEYRNSEQNLVRSQIQFYNVAGLNHSKDQGVSNSLKSLETLISECTSSQQPTGFIIVTIWLFVKVCYSEIADEPVSILI